ncbi:FkbM family methyltransferase [Mycobacterium canetti]|uniref:FkbM family methyltransferase n=1 Tax=Mycobacterium canetti TaxID=78331 RepID=UPI002D77CFCF|nr:FkbM family methyltransferase [Mycobacterium canetti]WRO41547.1 FkbM family methyltransferase [Mycobacterium canetti]
MQFIKDYLVRLGPDHVLVRIALRLNARLHGFKIAYPNDCIALCKGDREMILGKAQYVQVPWMMGCYDLYFNTIEGESVSGRTVLNFSKPGMHRYIKSQVSFYFPSIPEDDVIDAYTDGYKPQPGDIVWDAGAHAGASSYFLAQMVGPSGKVYAFEPDEHNYQYLTKNIALHELINVIPVKKALAGTTGTARFCMDGTMSAGLADYLVYSDERLYQTVSTISFADACAELGEIPKFVKMDIEGAEVDLVECAQDFLRDHPIHFSIESDLCVNGEPMYKTLERLFTGIGYKTRSSDAFGQMFTWADPDVS